jgi:hypothetical protein
MIDVESSAMHLHNRPTWFVKGEHRLAAYYTVQARRFEERGYVEEGAVKAAPAPQPKPVPEIVVEAGVDAFDDDSLKAVQSESLEEMTKAELLDWAMDHGHDLKNAAPKAEIFKQCKEIEADL